jgi:ElaB/YqjD/DUF883 family membrane-anchored ribosome-binding protein
MFKPANEQATQDQKFRNNLQERDTMNNIMPEIKDDMNAVKNKANKFVNDVSNEGVRQSKRAVVYLQDRMDDLKVGSKQAMRRMETRIRIEPTQSVAIAFGVGVLASYLLSRRSA